MLSRSSNLRGVHVAMISPLDRSGRVDGAGVRQAVEHVLTGGVDGIVALGSAGEGPALPRRERRRLLELVVRETAGRVPVMAGVGRMTREAARRDVMDGADCGADAVLVLPPFYFDLPGEAVQRFFEDLSDVSPLPIVLYNVPRFTKIRLAPETVASLALRENIVGIKDSSRDMEYLQEIVVRTADRPGFSVFTGSDSLFLCSLTAGAHGLIGVAPNLVPALCADLYRAYREGCWEKARALQSKIVEILRAVRRGAFPAGFKAALELLGICQRWPAYPAQPLDEKAMSEMAESMRRLQLLG